MSSRKFESAASKRKRKRLADASRESQRGSLDKFFKSSTTPSTNPDELAIVVVDEATCYGYFIRGDLIFSDPLTGDLS